MTVTEIYSKADRCYWFYNGKCIRPEKESCWYNLGKKKSNE